MSKKITTKFVRGAFEKEGYKLLTTEYKGNSQRLEYVCPKGHVGSIMWNTWQQGSRCLECSGKKKKDIEFIRRKFEKEGYQLLTANYINTYQKLEYVCSKGHRGSISWNNWGQGQRCAKCSGSKKKDINFIREELKKEGYQVLSLNYINAHQKFKYICPFGHSSSITWNDWSQGKRCMKCAIVNNSGENSHRWKNYTDGEMKQFKLYRAKVSQTTRQNFNNYIYLINPNNLLRSRNLYNLDHIFSVRDGFDNKVPPEIIASPVNLQMLPERENMSKHDRSDITKKVLYELYNQFERERQ